LLLEAGVVNKVTFFVAPLLIGGQDAPSAIAGAGAEKIADAMKLGHIEIRQHGTDVEITGYLTSGAVAPPVREGSLGIAQSTTHFC
jgi:diaminohydroxyphosphoribosylaminopyrimidine deaminase/5-amino-6-(5-phosphoribosylamino)uracil reductase